MSTPHTITIDAETADMILELEVGETTDGYTLVANSDWVSKGKREHMTQVFLYEGKHYRIARWRSGSHFTDYYWDTEDKNEFVCPEVEPVQVTVTQWRPVAQ